MKQNEITFISNINLIDENSLRNIPYPQANCVQTLYNFMHYLNQNHILTEELAKDLNIDKRQVAYYGNALRYLGFTYKDKEYHQLTKKGKQFVQSSKSDQKKAFIKSCMSIPSINSVYMLYKNEKHLTSYKVGLEINKYRNDLSLSTYIRRSSTILSWADYIDKNIHRCI
tara:strand:- start:417 stop:926 length:510 start_codon:yes stop_codon:yes gene_type:complete